MLVHVDRVDHVADVTLTQRVDDLRRTLVELAKRTGTHAVLAEVVRRTGSSLNIETKVIETADERQSLGFVVVGNRHENRSVVRNVHARCLQCLIEGARELIVITDCLTRRLHLGREVGIHTADLGEREGGSLHIPATLILTIDRLDTLLLERATQDHLRSNMGHLHAGRLREEGHGTRRTRVHLNHVNLTGLIHDELDVVQTHDTNAQTEFHRIVDDLIAHGLRYAERRIDADRVTRVDTRTLDMLHDTGDEYILAVADSIYLQLLTHDIAVYQDGRIDIHLYGRLQVVAQALLVRHDLHGATTQHIARTHQHGITDAGCSRHTGLDIGHGLGLGLRNGQLLHDLLEATTVLSVTDSLRIGSDDGHTQLGQRLGQVDGRLTTERYDDRLRVLQVDHVHHILHREGLEVELVAGRIVGRNGLRVIVDDDCLVAGLADRPDGVYGRVVELDTLTDTDRARTEHHDFLLVAHDRLILLLVRRVEVGHIGRELATAGIDHLVNREDAVLLTHEVHIVLALTPELADVLIAKAHLLGILQRLHIAYVITYHLLELDDVLELLQEEHVDLRVVVDHHQIHIVADELGDGVETIVRTIFNIGKQLVIRPAVKFLVVDVANTRLERAHSLQERLLHRTANGHHLTRRLHLRTELVRGVGELIEGEAGHLRHHVVDRRLERCGSRSDTNLIKRKTYGDLGTHAGDRETRSL